jgi:hypothetical protein
LFQLTNVMVWHFPCVVSSHKKLFCHQTWRFTTSMTEPTLLDPVPSHLIQFLSSIHISLKFISIFSTPTYLSSCSMGECSFKWSFTSKILYVLLPCPCSTPDYLILELLTCNNIRIREQIMEINLRFSWFWKCGLWSFRLCHHGYQQVTFRFHKILGISCLADCTVSF